MLFNEVVGKDILHVACIEQRVVNMVNLRVHLRVLNGFGHILDADDLTCLSCYEVGNGSRARVEVVY